MEELNTDATVTSPSTTQSALKYGAITGGALAAFFLVFELVGLSAMNNQFAGIIPSLIQILGIVFCLLEYKKINGGFISFGQGFSLGTMLSAIAGFIYSVTFLIYFRLVSDASLILAQKQMRAEFEKNPQLKDEDIEVAMNMMSYIFNPEALFLFNVISYLIGGIILSLIIGAILQKKQPVF